MGDPFEAPMPRLTAIVLLVLYVFALACLVIDLVSTFSLE